VPFVIFSGVDAGANAAGASRWEQALRGCTSQLCEKKEEPGDLTLLLVKV